MTPARPQADGAVAAHEAAATRLRAAYEHGPTAPLRDLLAATDIDGAYAVNRSTPACGLWRDAASSAARSD
jgi:hypothetical protein